MKDLLIVIVGLFLLALVWGSWQLYVYTPTEVICTQEAKICPDGTAVGRVGNQCEFAECPTL